MIALVSNQYIIVTETDIDATTFVTKLIVFLQPVQLLMTLLSSWHRSCPLVILSLTVVIPNIKTRLVVVMSWPDRICCLLDQALVAVKKVHAMDHR